MSFLDNLISSGKDAVNVAGKKADDAVRFAKLKSRESQLNGDIKSKFEKLGASVYEMAKSGKKDTEKFDADIAEISKCYDELAEISKQYDELRGEVACPNCGAKVKDDNNYCPKCGTKLPEKPVEPTVEETAAEEETEENDKKE